MLIDMISKGSANYSITIRIVDDSDGTPELSVTDLTAGLDLWYRRPIEALTSITETSVAVADPHTDGGFVHISDGHYRLDLPDAASANGANYFDVGGAVPGMVVIGGRVRLTDLNLDNSINAGLTSLPNSAADSAGGLIISDAGGLDADSVLTDLNVITGTSGVLIDAAEAVNLVDNIWDEVLTGATHNVATSAGRRLRSMQEFRGYENGSVWVDTVNGTSGTTLFENGTVEVPVLTFAEAITIASASSMSQYTLLPGSSVTFTADFLNSNIFGENYSVVLNNNDFSGTTFVQVRAVSGVATTASGELVFRSGSINNVTVDQARFHCATLTGTITLGNLTTDVLIADCVSANSSVTLDFAVASANHDVNISGHKGSLEIANYNATIGGGTDSLIVSGTGSIQINSNCDGGSISLSGVWRVTDLSGGAVSIVYDDLNTASVDISNRLPANLTGGAIDSNIASIAGNPTSASNLQASTLGLVSTTVLAGISNTVFTLSSGETRDDAYNGRVVVFTSGNVAGEAVDIVDYVGSTRSLTLSASLTGIPSGNSLVIV